MSKRIIPVVLIWCLPLTAAAQTKVPGSVLASGGGVSSNDNHRVIATIGQPIVGKADNDDNQVHSGFWSQKVNIVTSVEAIEDELLPTEFRLEQNYPNPFNPATTIQFSVAEHSDVKIRVYDILGREVAGIVDQSYQPGVYKAVFEAGDLPSGLYIYRIQAGSFSDAKKLMLLK
jgi:hypothetical protein